MRWKVNDCKQDNSIGNVWGYIFMEIVRFLYLPPFTGCSLQKCAWSWLSPLERAKCEGQSKADTWSFYMVAMAMSDLSVAINDIAIKICATLTPTFRISNCQMWISQSMLNINVTLYMIIWAILNDLPQEPFNTSNLNAFAKVLRSCISAYDRRFEYVFVKNITHNKS